MSNEHKSKKTIKIWKGLIGVPLIFLFSLIFPLTLVLCFVYLPPQIAFIVLSTFYFLNLLAALSLLNRKRIPIENKVAWSSFLLLAPGMGAFFYLKGGYVPFYKKNKIEKSFKQNPKIKPIRETNISAWEVFENGDQKFPSLIKDLGNAKESIYIQYFIINDGIIWNQIAPILIAKKQQGVDVKILVDYVGNVQTKDSSFKELVDNGIECIQFNPVKFWKITGYANQRTHFKVVIIDQNLVYTGGINIGDDYSSLYPKYGFWFDLSHKYEGKIVGDFLDIFIWQWYIETGIKLKIKAKNLNKKTNAILQTDGPHVDDPIFLNSLINNIRNTSRSVVMVTPYLVVPHVLNKELISASERGVKIEIILPGKFDKKSAYLASKVYENFIARDNIVIHRVDSIFLHSRFFIFDEQVIIVGTSNIDYRAIYYHYESNIISKDPKMIKSFIDISERYKNLSTITNAKKRTIDYLIYHFLKYFLLPL